VQPGEAQQLAGFVLAALGTLEEFEQGVVSLGWVPASTSCATAWLRVSQQWYLPASGANLRLYVSQQRLHYICD